MKLEYQKCPRCEGRGTVLTQSANGGTIYTSNCTMCNGSGKIVAPKDLKKHEFVHQYEMPDVSYVIVGGRYQVPFLQWRKCGLLKYVAYFLESKNEIAKKVSFHELLDHGFAFEADVLCQTNEHFILDFLKP